MFTVKQYKIDVAKKRVKNLQLILNILSNLENS